MPGGGVTSRCKGSITAFRIRAANATATSSLQRAGVLIPLLSCLPSDARHQYDRMTTGDAVVGAVGTAG